MFGNVISNLGSAVPDTRRLEVGSGRAYTTLDAAMSALSGVTWKSNAAITGTVAVTSGSGAVTGTGTTFLSQVAPNDYLLVGANYEPVKSIESNTALTLWSGSRATASGVGASAYKLNPYEIRIHGGVQLTTSPSLPTGLDLSIVGAPTTAPTWNTISNNIALPVGHCGRLKVSDLTQAGAMPYAGLMVFGGVNGRGLFEFERLSVSTGLLSILLGASAVTLQDISGTNIRFNGTSDYALFKDITNTTTDINDIFLYAATVATDIAHPIEFVRCNLNNNGQTFRGQNGGFEYNGIPPGKIVNFRNCKWLQPNKIADIVDSAIPCLVFTSNGNGYGTYNFYDSILDSSGGLLYEINNSHGAFPASTINFIRTTRADGVSLPRIANT